MTVSSFHPTDLEREQDPYPLLARLREASPVLKLDSGFWAVTGYDAAMDALRNPGCRSGPIALRYLEGLPEGAARDEMGHRINFLDPPDHTRVRGLVSKAFTPRGRGAATWIEATAERLLASSTAAKSSTCCALCASAAVAGDLGAARRSARGSRSTDRVERRGRAVARRQRFPTREGARNSSPRRNSTPISARCSTSGASSPATTCCRRYWWPKKLASVCSESNCCRWPRHSTRRAIARLATCLPTGCRCCCLAPSAIATSSTAAGASPKSSKSSCATRRRRCSSRACRWSR